MGLINKLFGTYSERQIKRIKPLADKIEGLADKYSAMSDGELRGVTDVLKGRLAAGETLDDILTDAFALVREAADRVLGKRPFYVQLLGGIILHQGRIAEMRTGEGKTLAATLPAYLNALSGKGVHVVTVNDYLARRDSEEMGRLYSFLGLTTGLVYQGQDQEEKQAAYLCDITYGTNNEFGFDYLRDNGALRKEYMMQRGHNFAIVDEVDSILIDEARTPLIISGDGEKSTDLYDKVNVFVARLSKNVRKEVDSKVSNEDCEEDYIVDEKARNAFLTKNGIEKAEAHFGIKNLSDPENGTLYHHINQALRAHGTMKRDVDYVVKDDQVLIVDSFTGRLMPGRRFSDGLHQAIEAKEHVKVERENRTLATITFQNFFRLYSKLSGMTGTALTEEMEFREIYNLDVVEVPTNRPMIREDLDDSVYKTSEGKLNAIIEQIKKCHEIGQPILVGTVSIEKSERLSERLRGAGIPHNVLNAKNHEREAEIIAQAGKEGAVTIATNMAGRGTDIMLGGNAEYLAKAEMRRKDIREDLINASTDVINTNDPEILEAREIYRALYKKHKEEIEDDAERVRAAGGLFVLGTERHESRRIDNQLRGRSGRQGDPGASKFFLSLEDDLIRLFGGDRMSAILDRTNIDENEAILSNGLITSLIEHAQKRREDNNFANRKNVLTYDDVMNQQRVVIYKQRGEVLDGKDMTDVIENMLVESITANVATYINGEDHESWDLKGLRAYYGWLVGEEGLSYTAEQLAEKSPEDITEGLIAIARARRAKLEEHLGSDFMRDNERVLLLHNVDEKWIDHLEAMEELKGMIGLSAYAHRNPVSEYRILGANMFDEMIAEIQESTIRDLLTGRVICLRPEDMERITRAGFVGERTAQKPKVNSTKKVGRNDPCTCGSGKKYKYCCGAGK